MASALTLDPRVPTGVAGLDNILGGGLPAHRFFLVQGAPGSGKTTLAMQFLLEGVRAGESCLYVTMSESEDEIFGVARSHGWDLSKIKIFDLSVLEHHLRDEEENSLFNPADVELKEAMQPLMAEIEKHRPQRIAFDSLSEMRMLASNPLRYRQRILALKQVLARSGTTSLFLDDRTSDPNGDLQLQSLAHGVIELEQWTPSYGSDRRKLRVVKLRGVRFIGGFHDVTIERGGAVVYPRLVAADHAVKVSPERLPSSNSELDALMGGGPARGTSSLIVGPAGSGKSNLVTLYTVAAAARGERVAVFTFEETSVQFCRRSEGVGLHVQEHIDSGRLSVRQIDPAEISPSEFAHAVRTVVEDQGARVVVLDSLNGYLNAMAEEKQLALQMHELLTYLCLRGVATFLVMAQHGLVGATMVSPIDVSYVADNVIMTRYFEAGGRVRKALSVVKNRAGAHESTIRELHVTSTGLDLGPPLIGFRGVLTGVPAWVGEEAELLDVPK